MRLGIGVGSLLLVVSACDPSAETECAERMPGAIYCIESKAGTPVQSGVLSGAKVVAVTFSDRIAALEESSGALRTITSTDGEEHFAAGVFGDRYCYWSLSNILCAPLAGGESAVWLRGVHLVTTAPDGASYFVEYVNGSGSSISADLRRVDLSGHPIGEPLISITGAYIQWLSIIGDSIVFTRESSGPGPSELWSMSLVGGSPTKLLSSASHPTYLSLNGKILIVDDNEVTRMDPATQTVEHLGKPLSRFAYTKVGNSLVAVTQDGVQSLDEHLQVTGTLWKQPEGPDHPARGIATLGNALYLPFERSPCSSVGQDKLSRTVCNDSKGRWQIVRIDVP